MLDIKDGDHVSYFLGKLKRIISTWVGLFGDRLQQFLVILSKLSD